MKPNCAVKSSENMPEAARRLFAESGCQAVSMDAVARTAGVSKATLHARFESKEKLFADTLEAESGRVEERAWIPERFEGDAEDFLRRLAHRLARFSVDGRGLAVYRLLVADLHRFAKLVERFHASGPMAMRSRLARLSAQMGERGKPAIDEPEMAADRLTALIRGRLPFDRSIGLPPPPDAEIERRVEGAARLFLRSCAPQSRRDER